MSSRYNHKVAEKKWQKEWIEQKIFETKKDSSKKKYYVLEMFPYPSGKIRLWSSLHYTLDLYTFQVKILNTLPTVLVIWIHNHF